MDTKSPKYISEIKKQITTKLQSVENISSLLSEHRQLYCDEILVIYREAFESLIDNLVTCGDILQGIKETYDNSLNIRDERIKMFITQDKIFGISSAKKKSDDEYKKLLAENQDLKIKKERIMKEVAKTKTEMNKDPNEERTIDSNIRRPSICQEYDENIQQVEENAQLHVEMFSDHMSLMEERNARYTLFFENVKLHMKVKELDGTNNLLDTACGDPIVLKIALDKCREQLTITQKNLSTMAEEYSDTVPRNTYDALEVKHCDLNKNLEKVENEYQMLLEKHRRALAENKSLKEEISDLKDRCSELERAGTPRPQWEICGDFIGGGGERWRQLKHGLTSREILRVILKELGPSAKTEHLEYFEGLGTDPVIPPYLQYEGKIRNLRLSRREISVIINDIWVDKLQNGKDLPMQDFVTVYFENRYQQPSVRAEWAYNLCSGAEQMLDDPQIKLFWGVLHGHLSEDIYVAHSREWYSFKDNLLKQCNDDEMIPADKFEKIAKGTFPLKSEVDIKNLLDLARKQLKLKTTTNDLDVGKLFQENEEGFDRIEFAKELYRQRQIAQDKYIREIVAELGGKNASNKMITVENLKRALALTDPAIDHIRMEKNIRWAFSDKKSDLNSIYPMPLKVLAAKLASGNIERAGARDKGRRVRKVTYKH